MEVMKEARPKPSFVTPAQAAVLRLYDGGEFEYLLSDTDQEEFRVHVESCGDTLLQWMLSELSDREDCDGVGMGIERIRFAVDRMQAAIRNLEAEAARFEQAQVRVRLTSADGKQETSFLPPAWQSPSAWRDQNGKPSHPLGQTVWAVFETFVPEGTGVRLVDSFEASGDEWRAIEDCGDLKALLDDVRRGTDLRRAVVTQADKGKGA